MSYFAFVTPFIRRTLARAEQVNAVFTSVEAGFAQVPERNLILQGRTTYGADVVGATNVYVVQLAYALAAYETGMLVTFKPTAANTGAASINLLSSTAAVLGAKALLRPNGAALVAGDLTAGGVFEARYDGAAFRLMGVGNLAGLGYTPVNKAGDTMTGTLTLLSGIAGTRMLVDVGRVDAEVRVAVAQGAGDLLSGTVAGDAIFYNLSTGRAIFGTAGAQPALFYTDNAERMRIDIAGNVSIGTTSNPETDRLVVNGATFRLRSTNGTDASPVTDWIVGYGGTAKLAGVSARNSYATSGRTNLVLHYGNNAGAKQDGLEIDYLGNVLIGTASNPSGARVRATQPTAAAAMDLYLSVSALSTPVAFFAKQDNNTTTSNVLVQFLINSGGTGSGQINANGASQAAFGSYSDIRLKNNVADLPPQLDAIMSLRPVEFDYIAGGHQIGFIAQEMQNVYPDAVGKDGKGMLTLTGFGKTEARIIKALQEAVAQIDALNARLAVLEKAA